MGSLNYSTVLKKKKKKEEEEMLYKKCENFALDFPPTQFYT